jgi:small subunit ribosomal protein S10
MRDLQSLHGPHVDEYLHSFLNNVQKEDNEFDILLGKLEEAFQTLETQKDGEATSLHSPSSDAKPSTESSNVLAAEDTTSASASEEAETSGQDEVKRKISEMEKRHQQMSPAERVVDLIDRLSVASQPLLQRMVHSEDKDLDQLLAELEADESASARGLPPPSRPLVQSPNTMPVGRLERPLARSPTHVLVRGQDPYAATGGSGVQQQIQYNQDDEEAAKNQMIEWMKKGDRIRRKGGSTMMSSSERKEMVTGLEALIHQAKQVPKSTQSETITQPSSATSPQSPPTSASSFDGVPVQYMTSDSPANILQPAYFPSENWFTTTPSIGLQLPTVHPRTHSIPVASLHFRSYFPELLDFQTHFVLHSAYALGIPVSKPAHLPIKRTLVTVLRGPFVHKKSQENWEKKVYKRAVKVWDCDRALLDGWLKYLENHGMGGVGMRITRWEWVPMDFMQGTDAQAAVHSPLKGSEEDDQAVKDLASKLVKDLEAESKGSKAANSDSIDVSTLSGSATTSTTTVA